MARRGLAARWHVMGRLERGLWAGALVLAGACVVLGIGLVLVGDGHTEGEVVYELGWDGEGTTRHDDGSWSLTTDDGTEVVIAGGTLTTAELTMVECEHEHGLWERLQRLFGVEPAGAGHAQDHDPVLLELDLQEDLTALATVEAGAVEATQAEPTYCEGHTAQSASSAADRLSGEAAATLSLEGTVDGVPFVVSTTTAWGGSGVLTSPDGEPEAATLDPDRPVTVRLVRPAAAMAEVLAAADDLGDDEVAIDVLRALADEARYEVVEP